MKKCDLCEDFPVEIDWEVKLAWSLVTLPIHFPFFPSDPKTIKIWDPVKDEKNAAKISTREHT